MGKPNPLRSPASWAKRDRTKLRSPTISVIHCAEPLLETAPGKPAPGAKLICLPFSANLLTSSVACQTATRRGDRSGQPVAGSKPNLVAVFGNLPNFLRTLLSCPPPQTSSFLDQTAKRQ